MRAKKNKKQRSNLLCLEIRAVSTVTKFLLRWVFSCVAYKMCSVMWPSHVSDWYSELEWRCSWCRDVTELQAQNKKKRKCCRINYSRAAICLIRVRDRLPERVIHLKQIEQVEEKLFKNWIILQLYKIVCALTHARREGDAVWATDTIYKEREAGRDEAWDCELGNLLSNSFAMQCLSEWYSETK